MNILDELWRTRPSERGNLSPYAARAKAYRNECGCAMGAAFFGASLLFLIVRGAALHFEANGHRLSALFYATLLMLGAAMLGKTVGIGIARIRLLLLHRELRIRYCLSGE